MHLHSSSSDFIKIVMYNNCKRVKRMAGYIDSVHQTLYGDVSKQELLDFHYRVLDYKEKSLAEIPMKGFSADYVYRETKRSRAGTRRNKDTTMVKESTSIFQRDPGDTPANVRLKG